MRNNTGLVILLIVVIVSAFLLMIVKLAEVFSSGSYRAKRVRERGRGDGLFHLLAPSAVGMVVCAVCLCGASWAWFTATGAADIAGIQSARFAVSVAVKQEGTDVTDTTVTPGEDGTYRVSLDTDAAYTITITPTADSTTSGYCKVEYGDGKVAYTDQLTPASAAVSFTVTGTSKLTITPEWGVNTETGNLTLTLVTDDPADEEDLPQDTIAPPQDEDNAPADDITDNTPGDSSTPGDNTPTDSKPADSTPDGSSSGDSTPADSTPGDSTQGGNSSDDNAGAAPEGGTSDSGTPQDAAGESAPAAADESTDGQA